MNFSHSKSILSRLAAVALLISIIWGCGRVPHLVDVSPPANRLPFVSVLLDQDSRQVTISIDRGQLGIDCYKNGKRYSYYSGQPIIVASRGQKMDLYAGAGNRIEKDINQITISPRGNKGILSFDGKKYRGLFQLVPASGQIKLTNAVYIEDYLQGVVPHEIGPTKKDQYEAIKAQAVAARTYAMGHLGQYGAAAGYDLKSDIGDQVYNGVIEEKDEVNKAIKETSGLVATYGDGMIDAYYHSTCGGATDDIEDVWGKDPKPYLIMVSDDGACKISKYYDWQERFTADQIALRLEQYLSREKGRTIRVGKIQDIRITGRSPGGRVGTIVFETANGRYSFKREKVRWMLGRSDNPDGILRSARIEPDIKRNSNGEITEVIFKGRGYGHGLGMCQMGARGLAAKGVTFDSILALYYQGTELKKLY